jgi:hypothetical protein
VTFLGLNDGLVEILGAVGGFFVAFGSSMAVLAAGFTVAVAGAMSMAAGAYIGAGSEAEVRATEDERRRFLGETVARLASRLLLVVFRRIVEPAQHLVDPDDRVIDDAGAGIRLHVGSGVRRAVPAE